PPRLERRCCCHLLHVLSRRQLRSTSARLYDSACASDIDIIEELIDPKPQRILFAALKFMPAELYVSAKGVLGFRSEQLSSPILEGQRRVGLPGRRRHSYTTGFLVFVERNDRCCLAATICKTDQRKAFVRIQEQGPAKLDI